MYFGPPTVPHGKTFTKSLPALQAAIISVGVSAPAIMSLPRRRACATVSGSKPGLTMNSAPASMQRRAASASSTVPAPITTSAPKLLTRSLMTSIAPGTVIVTSTIGMPPAQTASAACLAWVAEEARTIGTIPMSRIRLRISSCVIRSKASNGRGRRDRRENGLRKNVSA